MATANLEASELSAYLDEVRENIIRAGGTFDDVTRNAAMVTYFTTTAPLMARMKQLEIGSADHRGRIDSLEHENQQLRQEVSALQSYTGQLAKRLEDSCRFSYAYNALLIGITENLPELQNETNTRSVNFRKFVLARLQEYSATIKNEDFEMAHRLGKYRGSQSHPRPILVKFYSKDTARELIDASFKKRGKPDSPQFIIKPHKPLPLLGLLPASANTAWDNDGGAGPTESAECSKTRAAATQHGAEAADMHITHGGFGGRRKQYFKRSTWTRRNWDQETILTAVAQGLT